MCLCTFVGADLTYSRGVAAINKVGGGQIGPWAVGNTASVGTIGLITCVNMHTLVYEWGYAPSTIKVGGGGGIAPPAPLLLPLCIGNMKKCR